MAAVAKKSDKDKANSKSSGGSAMGLVIALLIVTVLAGGGGFLFATQMLAAPPETHADTKKADDGHGAGSDKKAHDSKEAEPTAPSGELVPIPPVLTNLAQPSEVFIRLEGSLVVEPGYSDGTLVANKVSEDVLALLKTMTLAQLQGSSGLNYLREDINERVKLRSEGKASELVIHTLIIE